MKKIPGFVTKQWSKKMRYKISPKDYITNMLLISVPCSVVSLESQLNVKHEAWVEHEIWSWARFLTQKSYTTVTTKVLRMRPYSTEYSLASRLKKDNNFNKHFVTVEDLAYFTTETHLYNPSLQTPATQCYYYIGYPLPGATIVRHCVSLALGRYFWVRRTPWRNDDRLSICEVEVYGTKP